MQSNSDGLRKRRSGSLMIENNVMSLVDYKLQHTERALSCNFIAKVYYLQKNTVSGKTLISHNFLSVFHDSAPMT